MGSSRSNNSSKERLKWTKELHDMFEKVVNQIGGPDRATPKGILRAMAVPGLTIFHVKSHLQKYRMSVFTREEDHIKAGGRSERRSISEMLPNFGVISGDQLTEALQIQKEAHRRLSDQNEVQKSLKQKFEAQGSFLYMIMEEFKNRSPTTKPNQPCSPIPSLPSLTEESDQSSPKEIDSNSEEVDTAEISSTDEFRAPKRIKIQDHVMPKMHYASTFNPEWQNLNIFSLDGFDDIVFTDQELMYPWSVGAVQSPLPQAFYHPMNW